MKQTVYPKRFLPIACWLFLSATSMYSQDILIQRNGDEIEAKVVKISSDEIEYKKWSNQDGPSYIVSKNEVFMIKYKNGEKDVFDTDNLSPSNRKSTQIGPNKPVGANPSSDNASLIEQYNARGYEFIDLELWAM